VHSAGVARRVDAQPRPVGLQQGAQGDQRRVQVELLIDTITVGRPMLLVVAPAAVGVLTPKEKRDARPIRGERVELEVGHGADQLRDQVDVPPGDEADDQTGQYAPQVVEIVGIERALGAPKAVLERCRHLVGQCVPRHGLVARHRQSPVENACFRGVQGFGLLPAEVVVVHGEPHRLTGRARGDHGLEPWSHLDELRPVEAGVLTQQVEQPGDPQVRHAVLVELAQVALQHVVVLGALCLRCELSNAFVQAGSFTGVGRVPQQVQIRGQDLGELLLALHAALDQGDGVDLQAVEPRPRRLPRLVVTRADRRPCTTLRALGRAPRDSDQQGRADREPQHENEEREPPRRWPHRVPPFILPRSMTVAVTSGWAVSLGPVAILGVLRRFGARAAPTIPS